MFARKHRICRSTGRFGYLFYRKSFQLHQFENRPLFGRQFTKSCFQLLSYQRTHIFRFRRRSQIIIGKQHFRKFTQDAFFLCVGRNRPFFFTFLFSLIDNRVSCHSVKPRRHLLNRIQSVADRFYQLIKYIL